MSFHSYLCFCMFNFTKLIIFYQNGQTSMAEYFNLKSPPPKLDLAAAPFFCCCKMCFAKISPSFSKKSIKFLWIGSFQALVIAPFLIFVKGLLMTDGTFACGDSWKTGPVKWLYREVTKGGQKGVKRASKGRQNGQNWSQNTPKRPKTTIPSISTLPCI